MASVYTFSSIFFAPFACFVRNTPWKKRGFKHAAFILFPFTMKCNALKVASVYTFSSIILRALCVLRGKYSVEKRGFKHAGL